MALDLAIDAYCFVCGPENPDGLHATFEAGQGKATGRYVPRREHQGYTGVSHGGILAALLDEAMVYAAVSLGRWVATAELTVRYSKPAPTDRPLTLHAEVTRHQRRLVECRAEIRSEEGTVLASATGKLIQGEARAGVPAETRPQGETDPGRATVETEETTEWRPRGGTP